MSYTPGPWQYQEGADAYTHIVRDPSGHRIIVSAPQSTGSETESNARLCAAAPDMYETLCTIAGFAPGNGDVCEIIAKRARAALAKVVLE